MFGHTRGIFGENELKVLFEYGVSPEELDRPASFNEIGDKQVLCFAKIGL